MAQDQWEELWRYRGRVAALVRRFGVEDRYVDDVVQETITGAWQSIVTGRYQPLVGVPDPLWCWVRGIAFRQSSNHRRRGWRRREALTDELPERAGHINLEAQIDAARELAALRAGAPRAGLSKGWIRSKAKARKAAA